MSFIAEIFEGGASGILKGVKDVVSSFRADPLELAKLEAALQKTEADLQLGLSQAQTKINEIEAGSTDKFVSRWRPAIGWLCGSGIAYVCIVQPIGAWLSINLGWLPPPHIEAAILMELLMGLLGLAGLRSFEKYNGVAK